MRGACPFRNSVSQSLSKDCSVTLKLLKNSVESNVSWPLTECCCNGDCPYVSLRSYSRVHLYDASVCGAAQNGRALPATSRLGEYSIAAAI